MASRQVLYCITRRSADRPVCYAATDSMVDGGDRGPGSPGIPRASSGSGMPSGGQAAGTPGKTAAGAAAAAAASKAAQQGLHKVPRVEI